MNVLTQQQTSTNKWKINIYIKTRSKTSELYIHYRKIAMNKHQKYKHLLYQIAGNTKLNLHLCQKH